MLEIKNLVKVYKTKGGADVRALDDVSLRFEEKGMVFLLGKSGSGKSTLLNLCGGLDTPDSGEIVIKGRSSKNFSQADFDSYRNTFVGFVFQEYNILDEFSVEENIALALELQGRSKDKARVRELLRQVEMEKFARRKPNTLSGGQKQRVAIARALVKNPEIIMADEPTGALDSNTGKQVFDTLKKLSEEKLVIVVSHDREFAEIYGDRIIELKDGKVISDVVKTKIAPRAESENIAFIGQDTINIQNGAALTDADMAKIRAFLAANNGNVIISGGKKEIGDFKKAARIDESGARETFRDTAEGDVVTRAYAPGEAKLIRSKLPARHAIRIGASSMKVKPFRLFFTVLLSFIAFTLFGLFSTLTFYNEKDVTLETYLDSGYETVQLQKRYQYERVTYENGVETYRSDPSDGLALYAPAELAAMRQSHPDAVGLFNYGTAEVYGMEGFDIENAARSQNDYYANTILYFAEADPSSAYWNERLMTETDLSALGEDDIVISSYLFNGLKEAGLRQSGAAGDGGEGGQSGNVTLNSAEDIVGKTLTLAQQYGGGSVTLTVRGVFRMDPPAAYASLNAKNGGQGESDEDLKKQFEEELSAGMYCNVLVGSGFYDAHRSAFYRGNSEYTDYGFTSLETPLEGYYTGKTFTDDGNGNFSVTDQNYSLSENVYSVAPFTDSMPATRPAVHFLSSGKTAPAQGEIVLPFGMLRSWADNMQSYKYTAGSDAIKKQLAEEFTSGSLSSENYDARRTELEEALNEENMQWDRNIQILCYGSYSEDDGNGNWVQYYADDAMTAAALDMIEDWIAEAQGITVDEAFLQTYYTDVTFPSTIFLSADGGAETFSYTLIGFTYADEFVNGPFLSQADYDTIAGAYGYDDGGNNFTYADETKYVAPADARYNGILMPFPDSGAMRTLVDGSKVVAEDDSFYTFVSPIATAMKEVNYFLENAEPIFLWVGVVMAVFSMLLLFNFISVSISNKKKEIGILRAVGARSADVFKIFFSESAIIGAICFVLAMVASFVISGVLNNTVAGMLGASIFVFGPLSWLVMLGIALLTSFIATFLPVYAIAKKRPVESIRAL